MRPCQSLLFIRRRDSRRALRSARRLSHMISRASGGPSALVSHFLELRIDHVFLRLPAAPGWLARGIGTLRDAGRGLPQSLGLFLNRLFIVRLEHCSEIAERGLGLGPLIARDLIAQIPPRQDLK